MGTLRTRASKGSELTHGELDSNFVRDVDIKTTTYAALVSDNRTTLECNHASTPFTVTLGDSATMAAAETGDYEITIANIGAAAVTVARAGTDTIDGAATSIVLAQYSSVTLKVNAATDGYNSIARGLGGLTSTVAELNILDGVTSTTAELNILDGVTSTTAELNILDGVTSTTAELNILDGATLDVTELNYVDGVTSSIQTQIDAKLDASSGTWTPVIQDSSFSDGESQTYSVQVGTYTKIGNRVMFTAELNVTSTGTLSGAAYVAGLPFTSAATANSSGVVCFGEAYGMVITAGQVVSGHISPSTDFIALDLWDSTAGVTGLTITEVDNFNVTFSGQYIV